MKLKHQLRDQNIEKEVNDDIPLGFFISNKIGGMLLFDARKDITKYYARVNNRTYKIIHDINIESGVSEVSNKFHSLEIVRKEEGRQHELFVPYYTNSVVIRSAEKNPIQMVFQLKDIEKGQTAKSTYISERDGRLLIRSVIPGIVGDNMVHAAIQGDCLQYDYKIDNNTNEVVVELMSPRIAISIAGHEQEAVSSVNHIIQNEMKIRSIQDEYISSFTKLNDPEASMAYACVLNGTDHMFLPDHATDPQAIAPVPHFSSVTSPHTAIAAHALLSEGEFGLVKRTLMRELKQQQRRAEKGKGSFEEIAWTMFLFGKMLNKLCSRSKLYTYFSAEDVKTVAEIISSLTETLRQTYFKSGLTVNTEHGNDLQSHALMLSIYNFAYALTKDPHYLRQEKDLREHTRDMLYDKVLKDDNPGQHLKKEDVRSLFLTAYIYPILLDEDEWKRCFDGLLERMHNSFQTLQNKMLSSDEQSLLKLEFFGLTSMAATVLYRIDPEHYEEQINQLLRASVTEVLYKGVIGRPTSSYEHDLDVDNPSMIENAHMLNNALFLEMLRECA